MAKQMTMTSFWAPKIAVAKKSDTESLGKKRKSEQDLENQTENETAKKGAEVKAGTGLPEPKHESKKKAQKEDPELGEDITLFDTTWQRGKPVPYLFLARVFEKVEAISGRLEITDILKQTYQAIVESNPEDLLPAVYLSINRLAPSHEGLEIGVGESILLRAISTATGKGLPVLKEAFQKAGDLGDIAANFKTTQRTMFSMPPLTIAGVFKDFKAIARSNGKAAVEEKKNRIQKLLVASKEAETKYLARALQGKLRIQLAERTVIAALAEAFETDGESATAAAILTQAFNQHPVWDSVIPTLLEKGTIDNSLLEACKLSPGVPISPMLAKPSKGAAEVTDKFGGTLFTCEYKYDGERAQIHRLKDGTVRIYSRNAENQTEKYPDVVGSMKTILSDNLKDADFIMDAEVVAFDAENSKILPFQSLQSRARRDVSAANIKVKVCIFGFDLLFLNGESLIRESLKARRQKLRDNFAEVPGVFRLATGKDFDNTDDMMDFLNESIKEGCEGLMVKLLEGPSATYEPANRSQNWLKVKKDYLEGMTDSVDLVPIAAYYGKGKRTGVFGAFLLACYNDETEEYETTCKIGTGFSEQMLSDLSNYFQENNRIIPEKRPYYSFSGGPNLKPDVWFEESTVWEVKCADLTLSPAHSAAMELASGEKGIGLRFPRFIRVREDREPHTATTSTQIFDLWKAQANND